MIGIFLRATAVTRGGTDTEIRVGTERGGGKEMGKVGDNILVITRMTPALRWAAVRAILMFH